MTEIYIKAWFGDWKLASKEEALNFARTLYKGFLCNEEKAITIINNNHLRGISFTIEELLNDNN